MPPPLSPMPRLPQPCNHALKAQQRLDVQTPDGPMVILRVTCLQCHFVWDEPERREPEPEGA